MKHNQTIRSARVLTMLLGISLAAEGFLNLITVLTAVRRTKNLPGDHRLILFPD